ncbi:bifunctional adenosylcobinamide kinase/adenosylcobinamide-phosphate guanylyltransferase [Staphylococcus chromogenes]|nr:bifunctional adenosylcobinamide kinase/adenosylcobinamide-phosphate guanylyltransferase [Staphylococcus chromogenes]
MISLVLGGARSGKSGFAEQRISTLADAPEHITYVATARPWPSDQDFAARIARHQAQRPAQWRTEDAEDAIAVLHNPPSDHLIIDDAGTWLTWHFDQSAAWPGQDGNLADVEKRCAELVAALRTTTARNIVLVTPEVGLGVIPESAAGRVFRDQLGSLNAQLAEVADEVHLVVAGIALTLKS